MISVYGIKSLSSKRIYVGQTNDIERRLREHNRGLVKSTKEDKPWGLMAIQEFGDRNEARWVERKLKRSRGRREVWLEEHGVAGLRLGE
jgi:putative endonuclease